MKQILPFFLFILFTLNNYAQNEDSILGTWLEVSYLASNGATNYTQKVENGQVLIFEQNNVVKDKNNHIGTYEINKNKLHIHFPESDYFYYFRFTDFTLSLTPVTSKYEIICDEGCTYIYDKKSLNPILIKGIITNEKNEPLPQVYILNSTNSTTSDFDGTYALKTLPNDSLTVSFLGFKSQTIKANTNEINIKMIEIPEIVTQLPYEPHIRLPKKDYETQTTIPIDDIKNTTNAKYNFKKNAKNNQYIIFVTNLNPHQLSSEDIAFQNNYNISYAVVSSFSKKYLKKHNKLTFKYLNKKYCKIWQSSINKYALGLDSFL